MSEARVERVAVRLFWKAEHLDPSEDGDVPESEWFSHEFPSSLNERRRSFWRMLAQEAIEIATSEQAELLAALREAHRLLTEAVTYVETVEDEEAGSEEAAEPFQLRKEIEAYLSTRSALAKAEERNAGA